jgi:hypothetical protein
MKKSKRMRWTRQVSTCGGEEECIWSVGRKARKKNPLGRPRGRRENNIKIDLREIRSGVTDWIDLARDTDQ